MNKVGYISNVFGGRGLINHGSHGSSRILEVGFFLGVLRDGDILTTDYTDLHG